MAIVINGSGTVTGLAVGGLPDGTVDSGTLATNSVTEAKIATDSVTTTKIPAALENTFVSGRKNLFINGGFDVWQRGTSLAGATSYLADRWFNGTTETQSRQTFTVGQTDVPHNPTYYHRGTSGSTEWYGLKQAIENVGITAGREVTLSYWMKGSSAFTNAPYRGQYFGSGGSSTVSAALSTASITTSWARYTHTFTLPSISGKTVGASNYMQINLVRANVNNITIDLANCQLEFGDTATDFEQRSHGEELALCQRYFYQQNSKNISYDLILPAMVIDPDDANTAWQPPTSLRATPTVSVSNADHTCLNYNGGNRVTRVNYSVNTNSNNGTSVYLNLDVNSNVLTVGQMVFLAFDNSISGGWIRFDAEL